MRKIAARKTLDDLYMQGQLPLEVSSEGDNGQIVFYLGTSSTHIGELIIRPHSEDLFRVVKSKAVTGYGPFMYDWAMEYVSGDNCWLTCDRMDSISDSAMQVWNYYLNSRSDVNKLCLLDLTNSDTLIKCIAAYGDFHSFSNILEQLDLRIFSVNYRNLFWNIVSGGEEFDERFFEEWEQLQQDPLLNKLKKAIKENGVFYAFKKRNYECMKEISKGLESGKILDLDDPSEWE